jgi:hypothetical protein
MHQKAHHRRTETYEFVARRQVVDRVLCVLQLECRLQIAVMATMAEIGIAKRFHRNLVIPLASQQQVLLKT